MQHIGTSPAPRGLPITLLGVAGLPHCSVAFMHLRRSDVHPHMGYSADPAS